jgi:hypothetical protein
MGEKKEHLAECHSGVLFCLAISEYVNYVK